jgi:hypothetical protein
MASNPNFILNNHRRCAHRLVLHRVPWLLVVISIREIAVWSDHAFPSDLEMLMPVEDRVTIYVRSGADVNLPWPWCSTRDNDHTGVQPSTFFKNYIPPIPGDFNPSQPGLSGHLHPERAIVNVSKSGSGTHAQTMNQLDWPAIVHSLMSKSAGARRVVRGTSPRLSTVCWVGQPRPVTETPPTARAEGSR